MAPELETVVESAWEVYSHTGGGWREAKNFSPALLTGLPCRAQGQLITSIINEKTYPLLSGVATIIVTILNAILSKCNIYTLFFINFFFLNKTYII